MTAKPQSPDARLGRGLALAATASLCLPATAGIEVTDLLAQRVGIVTVRPQLSVAERWDSNVLYRRSGEEISDLVSTISPGVQLEVGLKEKRADATLSYQLDENLYVDRDDLNSGNHSFTLASRYTGDRLGHNGTDRVLLLTDVLGGASNLGQTVDRVVYSLNHRFEYRLSEKTGAHAMANYDATDYASGTRLYDYQTVGGSLGFGYRPRTKVFFFGEGYVAYSSTHPNFVAPGSPDLTAVGGYFGARGQFTPKLGGSVKGGFEFREFSDGTPTPGAPVFDVSLDYRWSPKRTVSLTYLRRTYVSVTAPSELANLDSLHVHLGQYVGSQQRLGLDFNGGFNAYAYDSKVYSNRSDLSLDLGLGSQYRINKWCRAFLNYAFESFGSNVEGIIDYSVNRVTLKISVGY